MSMINFMLNVVEHKKFYNLNACIYFQFENEDLECISVKDFKVTVNKVSDPETELGKLQRAVNIDGEFYRLKYPEIHCRSVKNPEIHCRSVKYPEIHCRSVKYPEIHCRSVTYPDIHCRLVKYPGIYCRSVKYPEIHCRSVKYPEIHCRSVKYPDTLQVS